MTLDLRASPVLPEGVRRSMDEFQKALEVEVFIWSGEGAERVLLYPEGGCAPQEGAKCSALREHAPRDGPALTLEVCGTSADSIEGFADLIFANLVQVLEFAQEIRFFTYELSERYEEINLLYSISETLGSITRFDDAAVAILQEVCDVLGARRGSLWVHDPGDSRLHLQASVGMPGRKGTLATEDPDAVTSEAFRDGRPLITSRLYTQERGEGGEKNGEETHSILSVPVRYTAPTGLAKSVGVINLIGRRNGGRFTTSDQKLLAAIASQVGAAIENYRLLQESMAQERMGHEMELAHHLQMKLLSRSDSLEGAETAARVVPAEQVGGDFYHFLNLPDGRMGVMIGDVSTHGFPAALIMALSMSASSIYALENRDPCDVLRQLDDALRDELESTEMYLTLFYGVLDPEKGELLYSNAGHPHAFKIDGSGEAQRLLATDPPVGIAGPASYEQTRIPWSPEDTLFLFTDGLSDTMTMADRNGEEAVLDIVARHRTEAPSLIVDMLFQAARDATPSIPSDDQTAIVLRIR